MKENKKIIIKIGCMIYILLFIGFNLKGKHKYVINKYLYKSVAIYSTCEYLLNYELIKGDSVIIFETSFYCHLKKDFEKDKDNIIISEKDFIKNVLSNKKVAGLYLVNPITTTELLHSMKRRFKESEVICFFVIHNPKVFYKKEGKIYTQDGYIYIDTLMAPIANPDSFYLRKRENLPLKETNLYRKMKNKYGESIFQYIYGEEDPTCMGCEEAYNFDYLPSLGIIKYDFGMDAGKYRLIEINGKPIDKEKVKIVEEIKK